MSERRSLQAADVIVVGAGFAGLSAARAIEASGRRAIVLEARGRVGGRVLTEALPDGTPIDLGGQWIGPTQDHFAGLAAELGAKTFPTYDEGENVLFVRGRKRRYTGTIPRVDVFSLANVGWAMWRLDRLARRVRLDAPWETPGARALDAMTFATWLDRNVHTKTARDLLEVGLETVFSASPADYSLLHALYYVRSAGNLDMLLGVRGGAQQDRFVGGVMPIAERLAATLSDVRLSSPVRRIAQDGAGVVVGGGDGFELRAARVVVALPPTLAGRIAYSPALPAARDQLTQRMPMGSVIKCIAAYDTPFWRDDGLSGQAVSDVGPVHVAFDNSPPGGTPGILLGFVEGNTARALARAPAEERREAVLSSFARCFGERAKRPSAYVEKSWADDEWSRGCYVAYMPPGVWTSLGAALKEPVGRIHWAGTETAEVWNGYIDGAISSGKRAAAEVLAAEGHPADQRAASTPAGIAVSY